MSSWSELHAGAPDGTNASVTLPGVLPAAEWGMDLLSEAAGAPDFDASIAERLEESDEHIVYRMNAAWTAAIARITDPGAVARRFIAESDPGAADDADTVSTLTGLVEEIARVCRVALSRNVAATYTFTL